VGSDVQILNARLFFGLKKRDLSMRIPQLYGLKNCGLLILCLPAFFAIGCSRVSKAERLRYVTNWSNGKNSTCKIRHLSPGEKGNLFEDESFYVRRQLTVENAIPPQVFKDLTEFGFRPDLVGISQALSTPLLDPMNVKDSELARFNWLAEYRIVLLTNVSKKSLELHESSSDDRLLVIRTEGSRTLQCLVESDGKIAEFYCDRWFEE